MTLIERLKGSAVDSPPSADMQSINPDPLFDTAQAASYLHSSEPSLERFRRIGVGPKFVKMGGIVRYRRSDLDAYIDECTRVPGRRGRRTAIA